MMILLLIGEIYLLFSDEPHYMNFFWIPFVWTGIELLFYYRGRDYVVTYLLAHLYAAMVALGTDTGAYATSAAFCLPGLVTMLYVNDAFLSHPYNTDADTGRENKKNNRFIYILSRLIPATLPVICLALHLLITWGDILSKDDVSCQITDGPMKHLYTSKERCDAYYHEYNDIKDLKLTDEDVIYCGLASPLAYLDAGITPGTFATLFPVADMEHQKQYYQMHPEHFPTKVYYDIKLPEDFLSDPDIKSLFGKGKMRYLKHGTVIEFAPRGRS